ncbi:OmpA family protein [Aurantiacibacter aquimixticola]|uniref:OmpA family protein n=1 Tax=Aurantiacibacter aquimixticola TaxID=1958945 RepID=A0A419RVV5_9SPHN|nr:OmpA family protein [Aurantiacibacter aquimixticola]RJY09897.1 OmpA family protein [Aurantiacibacter aquimixticola]
MNTTNARPLAIALSALMAVSASAVAAQDVDYAEQTQINVYGDVPGDLSGFEDGPDIEGMITARQDNNIQVTTEEGQQVTLRLSPATEVRARGGFLGLGRTQLTQASLFNGLPVKVDTKQWGQSLIASRVRFSDDDLETAEMIYGGTNGRFTANETAIVENAAATEALRGRVANIDQYNVVETANVYFDTGKWNISARDQAELCSIAQQAEATDNALLLVIGYTDSVGDQDYNQVLSERRAGRVVNYLQQECDWQPWRMLTPTGMAEADPTADNSTAAGRAQNRRVAVNILVSKAVEGI